MSGFRLATDDAKAGKADVILSHFGHAHLGVEPFVQEGYGLWPEAVLSSRDGFIIPEGDPAKVAEAAASKNAYSVWGATAFKDWQEKTGDTQLSMVLPDGPIMSRLMVAGVVNPERFPQAKVEGAKAFVRFRLEPETQAQIATFTSDRFSAPPVLPAGGNNVDESIASGSRK